MTVLDEETATLFTGDLVFLGLTPRLTGRWRAGWTGSGKNQTPNRH
ncbi:hypothetical protein ACFSS8_10505 [Paracoccus kondratievae]